MIGDLCKPILTYSEQNTVRITMLVSEARELLMLLNQRGPSWRQDVRYSNEDPYDQLRRIIADAIEREDAP